jgi:hypothetical protein
MIHWVRFYVARELTVSRIRSQMNCRIALLYSHMVVRKYPWYSFPLFVMNKTISWTALSGFAITQVPGIFAHTFDAIHRDTLQDKPKWLLSFLELRKHLGLISLWVLSVHIFMSCILFSSAYYGRFFENPKDPLSRMSANGESSFMFGAFGAGLYIILGVCSLPSVAEQMTSKQWQFVYGPVAWCALAFGTAHVMCQGIGVTWDKKENWPGNLPPITLLSVVLPLFVMTLKLCQMIFVRIMYRCFKKQGVNYKKTDVTSGSDETDDGDKVNV